MNLAILSLKRVFATSKEHLTREKALRSMLTSAVIAPISTSLPNLFAFEDDLGTMRKIVSNGGELGRLVIIIKYHQDRI